MDTRVKNEMKISGRCNRVVAIDNIAARCIDDAKLLCYCVPRKKRNEIRAICYDRNHN